MSAIDQDKKPCNCGFGSSHLGLCGGHDGTWELLEALPAESVVVDKIGQEWTKAVTGKWETSHGESKTEVSSRRMAYAYEILLVSKPEPS